LPTPKHLNTPPQSTTIKPEPKSTPPTIKQAARAPLLHHQPIYSPSPQNPLHHITFTTYKLPPCFTIKPLHFNPHHGKESSSSSQKPPYQIHNHGNTQTSTQSSTPPSLYKPHHPFNQTTISLPHGLTQSTQNHQTATTVSFNLQAKSKTQSTAS
jgi:hypothetical protein